MNERKIWLEDILLRLSSGEHVSRFEMIAVTEEAIGLLEQNQRYHEWQMEGIQRGRDTIAQVLVSLMQKDS